MADTEKFIPEMITLKEAAERSQFSYGQLRRLCLSGSIHCIRMGKRFLINWSKFGEDLNVLKGENLYSKAD